MDFCPSHFFFVIIALNIGFSFLHWLAELIKQKTSGQYGSGLERFASFFLVMVEWVMGARKRKD